MRTIFAAMNLVIAAPERRGDLPVLLTFLKSAAVVAILVYLQIFCIAALQGIAGQLGLDGKCGEILATLTQPKQIIAFFWDRSYGERKRALV